MADIIKNLDSFFIPGNAYLVDAKSSIGFRSSEYKADDAAQKRFFFVCDTASLYGRVVWGAERLTGSLYRLLTHTVRPPFRRGERRIKPLTRTFAMSYKAAIRALSRFIPDSKAISTEDLKNELRIDYGRFAGSACYEGSAAALIAEGVIPDGFVWPDKYTRIYFCDGPISCSINRIRPDGVKGSRKHFETVDNWLVLRDYESKEMARAK